MGYYEYTHLPDADRERMFQAWCQQHDLDPKRDGVADDFIASLDSRFTDGTTLSKADMIQIIRGINPDITSLESYSKAGVLEIYQRVAQEASSESAV